MEELLTYFNDVASTWSTTMTLGVHEIINPFNMLFLGQLNALLNAPTLLMVIYTKPDPGHEKEGAQAAIVAKLRKFMMFMTYL